MSLISVSNLTFGYDGSSENVFENVSLQIDTDWRLGLVGRNGRGKTTLLRLLQGKYEYRGGISASVAFNYFPFPVPDPAKNTIDVLEDLNPELESWQIYKELSALEVEDTVLYRPYATLSGGEQNKVLLATLFLRPGNFLLIDEPTNHLDLEGRRVVSEYLSRKRGFILVSHDRAFLDGCTDHTLSINRQDIQVTQGNFSVWWENKARRDAWERAENDRLRKEVNRLEEAARRTADWSDTTEASKIGTHAADRGFIGHKAAKMMKRAKSTETRRYKAAEEKAGLLKNIEQAADLKLYPLVHPQRRLVEAAGLSMDYGDGPICKPISFTVMQGDCVALTGRNGAGKSSLLRLIAGQDLPHEGKLSLASGLVLSVVPQDASFLQGRLSDYIESCGVDESLFKAMLRKLDFSRTQFEKDMAEFSAGQKKKVLLARSLCEAAHLYIWDEPLNYIDLFSRMQLEALIKTYRPTLLLVEHDREFLDGIEAQVVKLERS
ncbi:MAG TPA: ABC-F type ribosomal protection protein [Pseudoflavonifractor sp.]|nr:ABC-F type ribosomal protection protein [Pseudoflavonifractor sp.]